MDVDDELEEGEITSPPPSPVKEDYYEPVSDDSDSCLNQRRSKPKRRRKDRKRRSHRFHEPEVSVVMKDFDESRQKLLRLLNAKRANEILDDCKDIPASEIAEVEMQDVCIPVVIDVSGDETELEELRKLALSSQPRFAENADKTDDIDDEAVNEFQLRAEALKTSIMKKRQTLLKKKVIVKLGRLKGDGNNGEDSDLFNGDTCKDRDVNVGKENVDIENVMKAKKERRCNKGQLTSQNEQSESIEKFTSNNDFVHLKSENSVENKMLDLVLESSTEVSKNLEVTVRVTPLPTSADVVEVLISEPLLTAQKDEQLPNEVEVDEEKLRAILLSEIQMKRSANSSPAPDLGVKSSSNFPQVNGTKLESIEQTGTNFNVIAVRTDPALDKGNDKNSSVEKIDLKSETRSIEPSNENKKMPLLPKNNVSVVDVKSNIDKKPMRSKNEEIRVVKLSPNKIIKSYSLVPQLKSKASTIAAANKINSQLSQKNDNGKRPFSADTDSSRSKTQNDVVHRPYPRKIVSSVSTAVSPRGFRLNANVQYYKKPVINSTTPRFVIPLGGDSSDDDDDDFDSPPQATLVSGLDEYLQTLRRLGEAHKSDSIPSTPEAVHSHLGPSQRIEYMLLKQKLAAAEKIKSRRKFDENTSTKTKSSNIKPGSTKNFNESSIPMKIEKPPTNDKEIAPVEMNKECTVKTSGDKVCDLGNRKVVDVTETEVDMDMVVALKSVSATVFNSTVSEINCKDSANCDLSKQDNKLIPDSVALVNYVDDSRKTPESSPKKIPRLIISDESGLEPNKKFESLSETWNIPVITLSPPTEPAVSKNLFETKLQATNVPNVILPTSKSIVDLTPKLKNGRRPESNPPITDNNLSGTEISKAETLKNAFSSPEKLMLADSKSLLETKPLAKIVPVAATSPSKVLVGSVIRPGIKAETQPVSLAKLPGESCRRTTNIAPKVINRHLIIKRLISPARTSSIAQKKPNWNPKTEVLNKVLQNIDLLKKEVALENIARNEIKRLKGQLIALERKRQNHQTRMERLSAMVQRQLSAVEKNGESGESSKAVVAMGADVAQPSEKVPEEAKFSTTGEITYSRMLGSNMWLRCLHAPRSWHALFSSTADKKAGASCVHPGYSSPLNSNTGAMMDLDPHRELCPHDLNGVCRDPECSYQHTKGR